MTNEQTDTEQTEVTEQPIPDKKGMARFWEILARDYMNLISAGGLAMISLLPLLMGLSFAMATRSVAVLVIVGVLGGMIAAPQVAGLYDTVLRSLRNEPFLWWMTYKQAWKDNFRCSLLPGALIGLVGVLQAFALQVLPFDRLPMWNIVVYLISVLLTVCLSHLMFMQLPLMELRFGVLFRNAVMLLVRFLPKVLLTGLMCIGYCLLCLCSMPAGILIFLIFNIWFPVLAGTMMCYGKINEVFQIESRLAEKAGGTAENP